mgnify:CR=1 FL=1
MRQGLTSRLAKLVMVSVLCVIGTPLIASEVVEFGSDESARYLTELKKLYLTSSDREALLALTSSQDERRVATPEQLASITTPTLVMHGDDDQIVPYENSGVLSAKLLPNGTLKTYKGYPRGMPTTHADVINADLLAFIRS